MATEPGSFRVVGAGVGRTGTHSLKLALERLLGGPCYHMLEAFGHPEHVPMWLHAIRDEPVDWHALMQGYVAGVDWPVGAFWRELSEVFPDAIILLSTRSSADAWWKSANATIFQVEPPDLPSDDPMHGMTIMPREMLTKKFAANWRDETEAKRAYEAHNANVRATAPASRLVEWQPGDGWKPLCDALGLPVPAEEFPHVNSTAEFRAMLGLDPLADQA
jgi:hypothetical protein